jgi:hypothetical protein
MPLDRGLIEQQLAALGEPAQWWERREMRDLPAVLHTNERIQAIAVGKLKRLGWQREWLIVVTDQRMVCLQTGMRMGRRQFDLHAGQITDLSMRSRIRRALVIVRAYGEVYRLRVRRADGAKLIAAISRLVPTRERPLETRHSPGAMVGRVIQHMLALPSAAFDDTKPPAPAAPPDVAPLEKRLQLLEDEVQRLQQQVDFLEDLLEQRSSGVEGPKERLTP